MLGIELTSEQRELALARHDRVAEIIGDYEAQHQYKLSQPWKDALPRLLLSGLSDPSLHLIFETLMRVEYEAGRLVAPDAQMQIENLAAAVRK
jgi:hypothetical protein